MNPLKRERKEDERYTGLCKVLCGSFPLFFWPFFHFFVQGGGEIPLTGLGRRKVEKVECRAGEYVQVIRSGEPRPIYGPL